MAGFCRSALAFLEWMPICHFMTENDTTRFDKAAQRFRRTLERIERMLPGPAMAWWARLRTPRAALIRLPLALLLVVGGVFSFLPVLGVWMLPLGLLLLAIDIPILRGPLADGVIRIRQWWRRRGSKFFRR